MTYDELKSTLEKSSLHPKLIEGILCRARHGTIVNDLGEDCQYIICDLDHVEAWCEETGRTDEVAPIREYFLENLHDFELGIMTEDFIWLYKGKQQPLSDNI